MVDTGVRVVMSAINRRLQENGGDGVFVVVKAAGVKGSPDDLVCDVEKALEIANQAMDRDGEELVWAACVIPTSKGPVVNLDWIGTEEQNEEWLDTFAGALTVAGRSGRVTAAPQAHFPEGTGSITGVFLSAQLAFTLADPSTYGYPPFTWLVDAEVTRSLSEHTMEWAKIDGAVTYLGEGLAQFTTQAPDPSAAFATAIERSARAQLTYLAGPPYVYRAVETASLGQAAYGGGRDGAPWQEFVDALREPLAFHGPRLDLGFVRYAPKLTPCLSTWWAAPRFPSLGNHEWWLNRHLFSQYVPDAHAIQVLTRSHLDKANDLSSWSTRSLGNDRYLVEAHDLEPWYTGIGPLDHQFFPHPEPDLLAAARSDFGAMILTHETLEADPDAWIPGRPHRPEVHPKPPRSSFPAR